jgi:hypothetical protein
LSELEPEHLDFAKIIAVWTIKYMQGRLGEFYYQNWNLFTNKIPYMRWGQAWMLLALSTLLDHLRSDTDNNKRVSRITEAALTLS